MSIESTLTGRATAVTDVTPEKRFVASVLPWAIAGGALLVFVLTLNHWVSLASLVNVAMVSGWNWQPELQRPLYWLVTSPFRLLPDSMIPLGLNFFSAVCAALTLGLLARSVALLPHDRTEDQRLREKSAFSLLSIRSAWLAPVLAALVCGLQLTFWENATAASAEILDLLLFAYVVRCILEFRLYGVDSWLLRACLVVGVAIPGNWAMIAFLPVFVGALIWSKGAGFFELRFLGRALLLGAVGLLLYLLLPTIAVLTRAGEITFWEALRPTLIEQKQFLTSIFNKRALFQGDHPLWVIALSSLLPVLAISIRWPAYFGDPSKLGVALATLTFHFLYAVLLAVCLWVSLDPKFSPRNYVGLPALPLYFLGALSVGYFAGYFLLIFGGARPMLRSRPMPGYPAALNSLVTFGVWALLLVVPASLVYRNAPYIRTTNGPMLRNYAEALAGNVATNSVVLSDEPLRLLLLKSIWTQKRERNPGVSLHTWALQFPAYHRFLAKQYPAVWKTDADRKAFYQDLELQRLVKGLSTSHSICYLHPSFGYYFERYVDPKASVEAFYPEPHGLVYHLKKYPSNSVLKPLLSKETIDQNLAFWSETSNPLLRTILQETDPEGRKQNDSLFDRLFRPLMAHAQLSTLTNGQALALGRYTSRAANAIGVELQRAGFDEPETSRLTMYEKAAARFKQARDLYPNNMVAGINLESNRSLRENTVYTVQAATVDELLAKYKDNIQGALNDNGPFDDPGLCDRLARYFFVGGNYRQAAQEFHRVTQLVPEGQPQHLAARLLLARAAILGYLPDEALKMIRDIQARAATLGVTQTNAPDLMQMEAIGNLYKNDTNSATKAIESTVKKYPADVYVLDTATKLYLDTGLTNEAVKMVETALERNPGNQDMLAAVTKLYLDCRRYSRAIETADRQLRDRPDAVNALYAKGVAHLELESFSNAAAVFTQVVDMGTNQIADLYYNALNARAYAFLKSGNLEDARKDYELLLQHFPKAIRISYFLVEIARLQDDTNAEARNYRHILKIAAPNTPDSSNALVRLKEMGQAPR